jgi:ribosomal protein L29
VEDMFQSHLVELNNKNLLELKKELRQNEGKYLNLRVCALRSEEERL